MKKLPSHIIGLAQALAITVYVFLVTLGMNTLSRNFQPSNDFIFTMLFLLLFVVSTLITGSMALGYPLWLFFQEKKVKESLQLIAYTTFWLVSGTIITILGIIFL